MKMTAKLNTQMKQNKLITSPDGAGEVLEVCLEGLSKPPGDVSQPVYL